MAAAAPVKLHRMLPPEEAARGDFYALIARLLHNAPDGRLLAALAAAQPIEGHAALTRAWRDLVDASSAMDADAAAEEYGALFEGVGKSAVSIYAGYYRGAPAADHPRVRLGNEFARLGLAPKAEASQPEDHFAALFDGMRVLVAGGAGREPASLEEQRRFFLEHLEPGLGGFLAALRGAPESNYYRRVAAFAAAFAELESESFNLE